ncbi:MAG TPA: hypothetical protein H9700_14435 [Candidatus Eisenbergiella intestinipullorum]|nr:hypothetical protein [Candidatus Eisenbergiella intestinipullorum]
MIALVIGSEFYQWPVMFHVKHLLHLCDEDVSRETLAKARKIISTAQDEQKKIFFI